MKMIRTLLLGLSLGLLALPARAAETGDEQPSRLGVGVHLGFNIGGALPPSVPKPVKKVTAFMPGGTPNVGLDLSYRLTPASPFSLLLGLEYDIRSFSSTVQAEDMPIRYQSEDFKEQHYTGYQRVEMDTRYVVVPVGVSYALPNSSFRLMAGATMLTRSSVSSPPSSMVTASWMVVSIRRARCLPSASGTSSCAMTSVCASVQTIRSTRTGGLRRV